MDRLSALEMLVRSAESRSFSAAARQLGLTPAAVSKQVARLERELGVQLVVRSTRSLALTEAGTRLVAEAAPGLRQVRGALDAAAPSSAVVQGTLRVTVAPAFARDHVLPHLGPLLAAHPGLNIDWRFDNRPADLVAEGFDAGISGGIPVSGGLVARTLCPLHLVLVASPAWLAAGPGPRRLRTPDDVARHDAIVLRSPASGRPRTWDLQSRRGGHAIVEPNARLWCDDPQAVCDAAVAGLGLALCGLIHAHRHLASGALVRVLPGWWGDVGAIRLYFPSSRLMPPKTRVFVDHVTATMQALGLARTMDASA